MDDGDGNFATGQFAKTGNMHFATEELQDQISGLLDDPHGGTAGRIDLILTVGKAERNDIQDNDVGGENSQPIQECEYGNGPNHVPLFVPMHEIISEARKTQSQNNKSDKNDHKRRHYGIRENRFQFRAKRW